MGVKLGPFLAGNIVYSSETKHSVNMTKTVTLSHQSVRHTVQNQHPAVAGLDKE